MHRKSGAVGYGRPPLDHRFRPGQSGNPAGRPKGRSFRSDLQAELSELVSFGDGPQRVEISKQRAVIKRVVAQALAGDPRAIATIMSVGLRALGEDEHENEEEAPEDREIIKAVAANPAKRRTKNSPRDNSGAQHE